VLAVVLLQDRVKPQVKVIRVRKLVPVEVPVRDLKAVICPFRDVSPREASTTSLQKRLLS
jgi:hypothetical protein